MSQTKEIHFEDHIEDSLLTNGGWQSLAPAMVDSATGVFVDELVAFVEATQPQRWSDLVQRYPSESAARTGLAKRVANELDNPIKHDCDSSCYDCLRDYRNMAYHPLLDWRLARDMLELGSGRDLDLEAWKGIESELAHSVAKGENLDAPIDLAGSAWALRLEDLTFIVCHPLEDTTEDGNGQRIATARALAEADGLDEQELIFVDTFDLLRRPAWALHQHLA